MSEIVFGRHAVYHLIQARRRKLLCLSLQKGTERESEVLLNLVQKLGLPYEIKGAPFFSTFQQCSHQGVIAETEPYPYKNLEELFAADQLLLCDGLQDPQNLGAICRSAYLLGVGGVVILENKSASISGGVCKSAAGAVEYLSIARVSSLANAIELLKKREFWIYGADQQGSQSLYQENFPKKVALVIGGEEKGLGRLVREKCDILLKIPMFRSEIGSYNASTAAALLLGEIARQRVKVLDLKR